MARVRRPVLVLVLLMIGVGVLGLPALHAPPGRDQGIFATAGLMVNEGRVLYRAIFEVKQPFILLTYAAVLRLGGVCIEAVNALDQIFRLLVMPLFYLLGARLFGRWIGVGAAACYGFMSLVLYGNFWNVSQAETFAGPLTALAFLGVLVGRDRDSPGYGCMAGAAAAAAVLFKATALLPASMVVIVPVVEGLTRRAARGRALKQVLAVAAGGFLVVIPVAVYFLAHGAVASFLEVQIGFNRFHTWRNPLLDIVSIQAVVFFLPWKCKPLGLMQTLPLLAALFMAVRGPGACRWLAFWYGLAYLTVPIQGKLWTYHYALLLPPQALLTAWCGAVVFTRATWKESRIVAALILVGLLALQAYGLGVRYLEGLPGDLARISGRMAPGDYARLPRFQVEGKQIYRTADLTAAADALRKISTPGDGMLVFGLDQTLNFLSGLLPTNRYLYSYPLVAVIPGYSKERERHRDRFIRAIQARPPRFLVLPDGPVDGLTGKAPWQQLQGFQRFKAWALARYEVGEKIGAYQIFIQKKAVNRP